MVQEDVSVAEELPIDIDYAKFLSWLVDRRRIPRDWHTHLKSARSLLHHAISITPRPAKAALDLAPPDPLTPPLPYFHARDIFAALTAGDVPTDWDAGSEKDLLGRYKGATSRAWAAAIAAFEKKDVYLADCAQALTRNTDVEAHALKDSIGALQREATELARRDAPALRAAAEARERFELACDEFDLPKEGDIDFYDSLKEAVDRKVPALLREAVKCVKEGAFAESIKYYANFVGYVRAERGDAQPVCETATRVIEGNVESLIRVRREEVTIGVSNGGVDWDIGIAPHAAEDKTGVAEIDWGIEIDTHGNVEGGSQDNAGADVDIAGGGGEIDWNESAETNDRIEGDDEKADKTDDSDSFTLADSKSRELYLNDLIELDAFLAQRVSELSRAGNMEVGLVLQQASGTPEFVKAVDAEQVAMFQESVQKAIRAINSAETRHMLALQSDSKRIERAARAILEKKHVAERMYATIDVLRKRRLKALEDLAVETPKLEELSKITRDIKKSTEKALSGLYKGRVVNILGEINNVFPPVE